MRATTGLSAGATSVGLFDHPNRLPGIGDEQASPMLWYPRASVSGCRLSLDRTLSVPTTEQTAKSEIFVLPHVSDTIECWSGEDWVPRRVPYDLGSTRTRNLLSISIAGITVSVCNDVFVRNVSGCWEIKYVPWNTTVLRSAANLMIHPDVHPDGLGLHHGRLVQLGPYESASKKHGSIMPEWLYLGTFLPTAGGQTWDSMQYRYLWNAYNRVPRQMLGVLSADRTTTATTLTELNSEIRIQFVSGLTQDGIWVSETGSHIHNVLNYVGHGISLDGAAPFMTASVYNPGNALGNGALAGICPPQLGFHYLTFFAACWVGIGGTSTYYSTDTAVYQCKQRLQAMVMA